MAPRLLKRIVRKIGRGVIPFPSDLAEEIRRLAARVEFLEGRALNRRWQAIDDLADYLVGAEVPGDYVEFGVCQGRTFAYAYRAMHWCFKEMKFIAVDSFEGLPRPQGLDAVDGYSSNFHENEFACPQEVFTANLARAGVDLDRVACVKGWFDQTLRPGSPQAAVIGKVAAAWIDCDLYESTVPVLNFLSDRLSVGAVILFDDWGCFRNMPDRGEQRACREWLAANPWITLHKLFTFGWHGVAFTVASC